MKKIDELAELVHNIKTIGFLFVEKLYYPYVPTSELHFNRVLRQKRKKHDFNHPPSTFHPSERKNSWAQRGHILKTKISYGILDDKLINIKRYKSSLAFRRTWAGIRFGFF